MERLIEQPSGTGDLLADEAAIARVHYALAVYRHYTDDGSPGGPAYLEVEGRVRPLDDLDVSSLHGLDVDFVLLLQDGRRLDLVFTGTEGTIHSTGRGLFTSHARQR